MQLSTSSNIHAAFQGQPCFDVFESMAAVKRAGFTHIDITLTAFAQDEKGALAQDDYRTFVDKIAQRAADLNLKVNQTHTLFYDHQASGERLHFCQKMVERCLYASGVLGVEYTVMHILRLKDLGPVDKQTALQKNVAYFAPYGDLARKYHVGIAIENGLTGLFHSAEELLALLDALDDDAFGLCWDTGHANITGQDQPAAIEKMGDALTCLHMNDNHAVKDEHLLPTFGNVDFAPIMHAIKTLAHPPIITYECPGSFQNAPPNARDNLLKAAVDIGQWLNTL